MKVKITLILSLILSMSTFARAVEICESKGVPEIAGDEVTTIMSTMKVLSDDEIKDIRNYLCMNILTASTIGFKPKEFKKVILEGLGKDEDISNKNEIISNFLNQNKQNLVCPKDKKRKGSRDLHVYKSAVLTGVLELYDEILLDDDEYDIDLNAFEIVDGKKETVVDYIEKLMATGVHGTEDLELLRDDILEMGGKRGSELE